MSVTHDNYNIVDNYMKMLMNCTTAAESREVSLAFISFVFTVQFLFLATGHVCIIGKYHAWGWQQCFAIISFVLVEYAMWPHFQQLIHVTTPLGTFHYDYLLMYVCVSILIIGVLLCFVPMWLFFRIADFVERTKVERVHVWAYFGFYYAQFYLYYALSNMFFILIDLTNMCEILEIFFTFIGSAIQSNFGIDLSQ